MENTIALISTVIVIHFLAVASPGPDFIVVLKNTLSSSRRSGLWTAAGVGLGLLIHILYCLAGIALLISQSILVFNVLKFLGAGYLIYIGYKSFTSSKTSNLDLPVQKSREISAWKSFQIGFLTNVLNPKATLFFLGLFTLVITPETSFKVKALLGSIMVLNTVLWFSLVAFIFSSAKVRAVFLRVQSYVDKLFGAFLVFLGIKIALTSHK